MFLWLLFFFLNDLDVLISRYFEIWFGNSIPQQLILVSQLYIQNRDYKMTGLVPSWQRWLMEVSRLLQRQHDEGKKIQHSMIACEAGKQELLLTVMLCRRVGPAIHQSGGKPRRHAHTQHNMRRAHKASKCGPICTQAARHGSTQAVCTSSDAWCLVM